MPLEIEIKNRHTGAVACTGETIRAACEANRTILIGANLSGADLNLADLRGANLRGADLRGADLSDADLRGANLDGADLRGADLSGAALDGAILSRADLREADLREADLREADLRGADLRWANLSGAYLRGAYLREANLDKAKLAWQSHDLLAELLRRAAGGDIEKRKVAGLIAVSRDMCWKDFLALRDPFTGWALSVLREYVVDGDDAPEPVNNCCDPEMDVLEWRKDIREWLETREEAG